MSTATVQPLAGCTLAAYATAKGLPLEFLGELRLTEIRLHSRPAVRIPYLDEDGQEVAVRFRIELEKASEADGRFRWKVGDKPVPYGLWRLADARAKGFLVLVEGESDAQTLWHAGIPALGLPGASSWRESWAASLEGIPVIYVVIEPDRGGETTKRWLTASGIRARVRLIAMADSKDPSALYLAARDTFARTWKLAMEAATPWGKVEEAEKRARLDQAFAECASLALERDILGHFAKALSTKGVTGEVRAAKLLYLCLVSRVFDHPVSAALKGPSSAGKSYLLGAVLEFFPSSAYYALSAMSERALAYMDESLSHRYLVLYEVAGMSGEIASYLVRSLLSEGHLRYATVEKTRDGLKQRVIERAGPTGLFATTTAIQLHPENETRLFSIPVSDSAEQTRAIMQRTAEEDRPRVDMRPWHALQELLELEDQRVTIPFARLLANLIPPAAVRLRRDFGMILSLVRSHALLHQRSRERDESGRILASVDDYAAVRELVADLVSDGVGVTVRVSVRETVAVVKVLAEAGTEEISVLAVAHALELDKSAASRRVRAAVDAGFLKNLEERRGRPAQLALGDPLPDDAELLPHPNQLLAKSDCTVAASLEEDYPDPAPAPHNGAERAVDEVLPNRVTPESLAPCWSNRPEKPLDGCETQTDRDSAGSEGELS